MPKFRLRDGVCIIGKPDVYTVEDIRDVEGGGEILFVIQLRNDVASRKQYLERIMPGIQRGDRVVIRVKNRQSTWWMSGSFPLNAIWSKVQKPTL